MPAPRGTAGRQHPATVSACDPADCSRRAVRQTLVKLDPRQMVKNPVMFVVEIGSVAHHAGR